MSGITCTSILSHPNVQSYRLNLLQGRLSLNNHGNPKRPLSSWNIYLQVYLSFRSRFFETYCLPGECATKMVIWSRLSGEDRKAFEDAAEELRKDHKMVYAGYKYMPVKAVRPGDTEDDGQAPSDGGPCKSRKNRCGQSTFLVGGRRYTSLSPPLPPTPVNTPIPAMAVEPEELDTPNVKLEEDEMQFSESQEDSEAQVWNWVASVLDNSVSNSPSSSEPPLLKASFPVVPDSPTWSPTFEYAAASSSIPSPSSPSLSMPDIPDSPSPSPSKFLHTSAYGQGESPLVVDSDDKWLKSPYWDLRLLVAS